MFRKIGKISRKINKKTRLIYYRFNILLLILIFSCSLIFPHQTFARETGNIKLQGIVVEDALLPVLNSDIDKLLVKSSRLPKIKDRELEVFAYRYVTAYNVGVVAQTDNTPCIGASGDNLCELVEQGIKVCAANFVSLGTHLEIEGIGTCKVLDRMNIRYASRVDIAMTADEIAKAKEFGLKRKKVAIY